MARELIKLVKSSDRYAAIYQRARASRNRVTTGYDASSICNLFCEGCLFFNRDGGYSGETAGISDVQYGALFKAEAARGVNYPVIGGAEPSLSQPILRQAAKIFSNGMIHTNGIKSIDPSLPFRLYVSCWGNRISTKKMARCRLL